MCVVCARRDDDDKRDIERERDCLCLSFPCAVSAQCMHARTDSVCREYAFAHTNTNGGGDLKFS